MADKIDEGFEFAIVLDNFLANSNKQTDCVVVAMALVLGAQSAKLSDARRRNMLRLFNSIVEETCAQGKEVLAKKDLGAPRPDTPWRGRDA